MWVTINHLKKVDCFNVKPNVTFNVEEITGMSFKNPSFLYTYKRCVSKNVAWDGELTIDGRYPFYMIRCHNTIDPHKSIIQVFIIEGDDYEFSDI